MARGYPDYEGGKVNIADRREWGDIEGREKRIGGVSAIVKAFGETLVYNGTPDATENWYFTHVSVSNRAAAAADADNNQFCEVVVGTTIVDLYRFTVNGGGVYLLPDVLKLTGGGIAGAQVTIVNRSNHGTIMGVQLHGYIVYK